MTSADHGTEEMRKKRIPKGPYCYDENGLCPYWSVAGKGEDRVTHCSFLGITDEDYFTLEDQIKECAINDDFRGEDLA